MKWRTYSLLTIITYLNKNGGSTLSVILEFLPYNQNKQNAFLKIGFKDFDQI